MNRLLIMPLLLLASFDARADLFGGDLPLLTQIVVNTLQTLQQLQSQTSLLESQMAGIKDKVHRIQTIAEVVQPTSWDQWRDPGEALRRLKLIYHTLPQEYRSSKSDEIEEELSKAMNLAARVGPGANTTFLSGKELERRGADASPAVAQKLAASGIGTLISLEAQSQIIQTHVTSLLARMLADANEKESMTLVARGSSLRGLSQGLGPSDGLFSSHVVPMRMSP